MKNIIIHCPVCGELMLPTGECSTINPHEKIYECTNQKRHKNYRAHVLPDGTIIQREISHQKILVKFIPKTQR